MQMAQRTPPLNPATNRVGASRDPRLATIFRGLGIDWGAATVPLVRSADLEAGFAAAAPGVVAGDGPVRDRFVTGR